MKPNHEYGVVVERADSVTAGGHTAHWVRAEIPAGVSNLVLGSFQHRIHSALCAQSRREGWVGGATERTLLVG